jgi:hypothetical protein
VHVDCKIIVAEIGIFSVLGDEAEDGRATVIHHLGVFLHECVLKMRVGVYICVYDCVYLCICVYNRKNGKI